MSENTGESLRPAEATVDQPRVQHPDSQAGARTESGERPGWSLADVRRGLTDKATALAVTAALVMPGVAYTENADADNDGRLGVTTSTVTENNLTTKILAEYKSNYGDGPDPEGELAEDAAVHAELFARDVSRAVANGGELLGVRVDAQSSAEAHSEARREGENLDTSNANVQQEDPKNKEELSADRRDRGMNLVEEVVRRDLLKNGVALPTVIPGNLGEDTWSDTELQSVVDIAQREGYKSAYWLTQAVNRDTAELKPEDQATVDALLKDQRWIKLIAQIRTESTTTDLPEAPIVKETEFAVPAYWTVPLNPGNEHPAQSGIQKPQYTADISFTDKRPREYNMGKNKQTDKRHPGRLARSHGGDQGGASKGRKSH